MKLGCMLITHNNGTGSRKVDLSKGPPGVKAEETSCITMCLDSYFATTWTDCPLVVIDDGSTDDSPSLIAGYGSKVTEFIRKDSNEGLTSNMNEAAEILIKKYKCDAICRFDGDIEFLTPGWDARFVRCFEENPNAGAVGGLQLSPFGSIWALGDMLIHPKGYVHILGYPTGRKWDDFSPLFMNSGMVLGNMECDSVMGCLAAFRSDVFEKIGRLRPEFLELRGETEDLNLRIMLAGYRCMALGSVMFIHRHMEHSPKKSATYDQGSKVKASFDIWKDLWGWDKMMPDMNAIYERWQGTLITRNLLKLPDGSVEYIGPQ